MPLRFGRLFVVLCMLLGACTTRALTDTLTYRSHFQVGDTTLLRLSEPSCKTPEIILTDSISVSPDSRYWLKLLKEWNLNLDDPQVIWPNRFVEWCVGVYNWANRTFNSHDPAYVKPYNNYHAKVMLSSDNWLDGYNFRVNDIPSLRMLGSMYANMGIYAKYSALSVGYSIDMNSIFSGNKSRHKKWDFGFNCSRFNIELHLWRNDGGTYIRQFGHYNKGHLIRLPFNGLVFSAWNIHGYYLFNSRKFSWGAAYSYDNTQRISQGSAILGLDIAKYRVDFDFTQLPRELQDYHQFPLDFYRFRYMTYSLIGGYTFNWVWNKHIVCNITAIPGLGITSSDLDSSHGKDILLAASYKLMGGWLYTNKRLFIGAKGSLTGNAFLSGDIDFLSNIVNFQVAVGLKF